MLPDIGAVAFGGAVGSVLRFLITWGATTTFGLAAVGTVIVNVIGCFLIGGLAEAAILGTALPDRMQLAVRVGLLGGLTTFSTFGYETLDLGGKLGSGPMLAYLVANLGLGLAAVWLGIWLARTWLSA